MGKNRKDRKHQVMPTKIEREAEEIARTADKMAKYTKANAAHGRANRATKSPNAHGPSELANLLGQEEEDRVRWLMTVGDCEEVVSRVPSSQTTGLTPVDLYRKTEWINGVANNVNVQWGTFANDCWHEGLAYQNGILHANGGTSCYGTATQAAFANGECPTTGPLAVGVTAGVMGDVSEDFVSSAIVGTEYMQVAAIHSASCLMPPSSASNEHFVGRAYIFQTLDPERAGLTGQSIADLRAVAAEENASVYCSEFIVTPGGTFLPVDFIGPRSSSGDDGFTQLCAAGLPLTNAAYRWRRIGGETLNVVANQPVADIAFAFYVPQGTTVQYRSTYLWQTETYATNRVQPTPLNGWGPQQTSQSGWSVGHSMRPMRPPGPQQGSSSRRYQQLVAAKRVQQPFTGQDRSRRLPMLQAKQQSTLTGVHAHHLQRVGSTDEARFWQLWNDMKVQLALAKLLGAMGRPLTFNPSTGKLIVPEDLLTARCPTSPNPEVPPLQGLAKIGKARLGRGIKARHAVASVVSDSLREPGVHALAKSAPGGFGNMTDSKCLADIFKAWGPDALDVVLGTDSKQSPAKGEDSWFDSILSTAGDFFQGAAPFLPLLTALL